jgi:hypothetical protein
MTPGEKHGTPPVSEPTLPLLPRTAPVIEQRPGTGNRTMVASSTVLPTSQASEVRACARMRGTAGHSCSVS